MPTSPSLDPSWLSQWVQPQHLSPHALSEHRRDFSTHPVRLHVVRSFLVDACARQLSAFLEHEATFQTVFGLYSDPDGVVEPAWASAEDSDRFYRMGVMAGVQEDKRLGANVLAYLRFRRMLADDRMLTLMEALTGLPIGAPRTTVHAMRQGDYLLVHDDQVKDRQLAFVLFLTPDWPGDAGGTLRLFSGGETWQVTPEYNSLVVFDVRAQTSHEVTAITPAAGHRARLTISGWFTQPAMAQ